MGAPRYLTEARLTEILRRQDPPRFGSDYEPAIKPTREEAPPNCRPASVWSEKLGRFISTMSRPERKVLSVILYCPWLFDLHDQRMLPILPSKHPLFGHPRANGLILPSSRGTLIAADELHYLQFHPTVLTRGKEGEPGTQAPGCFIGDFLLFILDATGPFCVNINVKSNESEFQAPRVGVTLKTNKARARLKEIARHEIERSVYAEYGIPTHQVAGDDLPEIMSRNLEQLLLWQNRKHGLPTDKVALIVDAFSEALVREIPALEIINSIELSHRISAYTQKIVLYQAIYARVIRTDLFESHMFIDKPMQPETRDVLELFGHWFRRDK